MVCKLFVCSQDIIVDFQSKRISAIHILENMTVASFPVPLQCAIYSYVERTREETNAPDIRFEIKLGESSLAGGSTNIVFVGGQTTAKNVAKLMVIIPTAGRLSFNLFYETTRIAFFEIDMIGQNLLQNPAEYPGYPPEVMVQRP